MLRRAIDEPTQRAPFLAVLTIFAFARYRDRLESIKWWRTQHPGPVFSIRNGGGMAPGMEAPICAGTCSRCAAGRGAVAGPHAPGGNAARNRFHAPLRARG